LLNNRHQSVSEGLSPLSETIAWKMWKLASLKRGLMNMANGALKTKVVNTLFKGWKNKRTDITFSNKTFNQMWKEKNK
jgi:L-lactate dehydrogenase complex protein LldF